MNIKTKYSIGQKVFFMHENKIKDGIIRELSIQVNDGTRIQYTTTVGYCFKEEVMYPTRKSLITDLLKEDKELIKAV